MWNSDIGGSSDDGDRSKELPDINRSARFELKNQLDKSLKRANSIGSSGWDGSVPKERESSFYLAPKLSKKRSELEKLVNHHTFDFNKAENSSVEDDN